MENVFTKSGLKKNSAVVYLLALLSACNNGDDPAPVNKPACKLISEITTSSGTYSPGVTFTLTRTNTYSYDDSGNRNSLSLSTVYTYSDGTAYRRTGVYNYEYDDKGFPVHVFIQDSSTEPNGTATNTSNDHRYEYDKDRLSVATYKSTDNNGIVTVNKLSYEYDSEGRLIKMTNIESNAYSKFEYIGDHVYKITRVSAAGNSSSPLIEFNSDGFIMKSVVGDEFGKATETRYVYNSEGLTTRYEIYYEGKAYSAEESEYDDKNHPYSASAWQFKGHPQIPSTGPQSKFLHNTTKSNRFEGNPTTGQFDPKSETVYTYEYNAENLPVKIVAKTIDKNGDELPLETTVLQYQGCP